MFFRKQRGGEKGENTAVRTGQQAAAQRSPAHPGSPSPAPTRTPLPGGPRPQHRPRANNKETLCPGQNPSDLSLDPWGMLRRQLEDVLQKVASPQSQRASTRACCQRKIFPKPGSCFGNFQPGASHSHTSCPMPAPTEAQLLLMGLEGAHPSAAPCLLPKRIAPEPELLRCEGQETRAQDKTRSQTR